MTECPRTVPRLIPPTPTPPARELPVRPFIRMLRVNGVACWPQSAYEVPVQRGHVLGRTRITVNDPEAVRCVFVENA